MLNAGGVGLGGVHGGGGGVPQPRSYDEAVLCTDDKACHREVWIKDVYLGRIYRKNCMCLMHCIAWHMNDYARALALFEHVVCDPT